MQKGGGLVGGQRKGGTRIKGRGGGILFPHPEQRGWWYWYLCHMIASINFAVLRPTDKLL